MEEVEELMLLCKSRRGGGGIKLRWRWHYDVMSRGGSISIMWLWDHYDVGGG